MSALDAAVQIKFALEIGDVAADTLEDESAMLDAEGVLLLVKQKVEAAVMDVAHAKRDDGGIGAIEGNVFDGDILGIGDRDGKGKVVEDEGRAAAVDGESVKIEDREDDRFDTRIVVGDTEEARHASLAPEMILARFEGQRGIFLAAE